MSYLVNQAKFASVSIGGVDYTDNFVSFQCADLSANRRGLLTTTGQLTLGYEPGGFDISRYDRMAFKRGTPVIINIKKSNGATIRHPRGLLYVLSNAYEPDSNTLVLELGCRLALLELSNTEQDLQQFLPAILPITLKEEEISFNSISTALTLVNKVIYQNNVGNFITKQVFPNGLGYGAAPSGSWLSCLGLTALNVNTLSGTNILPDGIDLTITYEAEVGSNPTIQIDTETNNYFIEFPMKSYERVAPSNGLAGTIGSTPSPYSGPVSSNCGNTPSVPPNRDNPKESCSNNFAVVDVTEYFNARNTSTQITYNDGPAGQTSRIIQEVYGPEIEVNSQYFTDKYAYCIGTYSSYCNPAGFCRPEGFDQVLQGRTITEYRYGSANQVTQEIVSNYLHLNSAAQPSDWRSLTRFTQDGTEEFTWRNLSFSSSNLYLHSRTITTYFYFDNCTKQVVETYTSIATRGVGISRPSELDAMRGIKTTQTRVSATLSANPDLPDSSAEPEVEQIEGILPTRVFINSTLDSVNPYYLQESFPFQIPGATAAETVEYAEDYLNYLKLMEKGSNLGLRITESLHDQLLDTWSPCVIFWYHDPTSGEVLLMSMDAASWAIEADGAVVTFQALWLGRSNGTVVLPSNF